MARLVQITPAEACRIGRVMGREAALCGADAQDVINVVCGRKFWRLQEERVRNAFAYAFGVAFTETEHLS